MERVLKNRLPKKSVNKPKSPPEWEQSRRQRRDVKRRRALRGAVGYFFGPCFREAIVGG